MATQSETAKALQSTAPPQDIREMIKSSIKDLGKALPAHLSAERIAQIALTEIRKIPDLALCTPDSFIGALFTLAQVGLEPIHGRAYLLPFNNKRKINGEWKTVKEVQAIIGYKGVVDLFYRHEKSLVLSWAVVKKEDVFSYELGSEAKLRHAPAMQNRGATIGFWVMAELKGGGKVFHYMSREDCLEHGKKHSKTWDRNKKMFYPNSPWSKDEEPMCLKTVFVQLSKLLPLSSQLQAAISVDESSRRHRPGVIDVMQIKDTTDWSSQEEPQAPESVPESKAETKVVTPTTTPKNDAGGVTERQQKAVAEEPPEDLPLEGTKTILQAVVNKIGLARMRKGMTKAQVSLLFKDLFGKTKTEDLAGDEGERALAAIERLPDPK